ncbi:PHP domain-containing protein [Eubacterium sp. 1001713B170207_170306_E7]|uniref:PHP domain-containing protein n=1 Tax=Eubacterium sp. 1001713B170207_170306_E7 TaxID=2787097 RepID=UPI00189B6894|nr:PHP domain-containing protein [Eubacterium sp. 1001713B170207_170306_E7]
MKLLCDMHTHTTYSHGKNTIEEMVEQARALGLRAIVISDHGRSHPMFGVRKKNFEKMRREIDALNEKYDDIEIYLSVESNITGADGSIDIGKEERQYCDWIYAGYHYGYIPASIKDVFRFAIRNYLTVVFPFMKEKTRRINTGAYLKMMDRYALKMITHPGDKLPVDIEPIAKKAAEKGVILEINPRHSHLNSEELKIALKYNVRFAVNSDAHSIQALGQVQSAEAIIKEAGVPCERIVNIEA